MMKNTLLATTAIALTGFAGSARAIEVGSDGGLKMDIGGYFTTSLAATSVNSGSNISGDYGGVDMNINSEVWFQPSLMLDNGIKIGAQIELEGNTSGDQIDETYLFITGDFGKIIIGSENSVGYKMTVAAPDVSSLYAQSSSLTAFVPYSGSLGYAGSANTVTGTTYANTYTNTDEDSANFGEFISLDSSSNGSGTSTTYADSGTYVSTTVSGVNSTITSYDADGVVTEIATYTSDSANITTYVDGVEATNITYDSAETTTSGTTSTAVTTVELGSDLFRGTLGSTFIENTRNNDAQRISYFSPRFGGLQFGASYAHDGGQGNGAVNNDDTVTDIIDLAVNYSKKIGGLDLNASARWGKANGTGDVDPRVWGAGLKLGFGDFTVGGSFAEQDGTATSDGNSYDVGVGYSSGKMSYSLTYFRGRNVDNANATVSFDAVAADTDNGIEAVDAYSVVGMEELKTIMLAAKYKVASNFSVGAFIAKTSFTEDYDDFGGSGGDNIKGTVVGLSASFSF